MKKSFFCVLCFLGIASSAFSAENYTLVSGDYKICVSAKNKHTIRSIEWRGYQIGTPSGYYGAIVIPAPGKYIGAGHTEGGVEDVKSVSVACDGKKIAPEAAPVIQGRKITVEKVSQFDNALFRIRLELTPEGLIETKRFVAQADQNFQLFYAHIFCFDKATTDYLAKTAGGKILSEKFTGERVRWHVNSNVKYIVQYNASRKSAVMLYYPTVIEGALRKACIWEVPRAYNKFYMMTKVPKVAPAGWQSPVYTVILRCFEADDAEALPAKAESEAAAAARIPVDGLPTDGLVK